MLRSFARKLTALLLLLALVAGGDRFAAMAMDMDGAQTSDTQRQDMGCKACDGMTADTPCDALCAALPVIEAAFAGPSALKLHERWTVQSDSGTALSIRPATSPPRA